MRRTKIQRKAVKHLERIDRKSLKEFNVFKSKNPHLKSRSFYHGKYKLLKEYERSNIIN